MKDLDFYIKNRMNLMFDNGSDYFDIHELNSKINYNDIILLWSDYVLKKYASMFKYEHHTIYDEYKCSHKNVINLCKYDLRFAFILEDLFEFHFNYEKEDMLLFYIKNSDSILIKLKSYYPIIYGCDEKEENVNEKRTSPYWNILISDKEIIKDLNYYMEDYEDNSLCILCY
jgi:hypothetical protein